MHEILLHVFYAFSSTSPSRRPTTLRWRVVVVGLLTCVAALLAPATTLATAAPDPVTRVIAAATSKQQITISEARELRATWAASATAARRARTPARRANIVAVRAYTRNLAVRGALTGDRLRPAMLSVWATTKIMRTGVYPSHEGEIVIPGEEAVFTYYSNRGVQFQPFETFKRGMGRIYAKDVVGARAIADRMLELSTTRSNTRNWEFFFPFGGPSRPWTSAISQAEGLLFFHRLALALPEAERGPYVEAAAAMVRSLARPTSSGGLAAPEGNGRFYVMYSFNPGQRILNGHLEAILNLHRYWKSTGSADAKLAYDDGHAAVIPMMPRFDTGEWSNYLPGQEAEIGYHDFQMSQLLRLGRETGDPTFAEYGERFQHYREDPPELTVIGTSWRTIFPAKDGLRDSAAIGFNVDKRSRVTIVVTNAAGVEVRRLSMHVAAGRRSIRWDGHDSNGRMVATGSYTARLIATDRVGNRSFHRLRAPLLVELDVTAPQPGEITIRATGSGSRVTVSATDPGSAWVRADLRVGRTLLASGRGKSGAVIALATARPLEQVRKGTLVLRDSSGNVAVIRLTTKGAAA